MSDLTIKKELEGSTLISIPVSPWSERAKFALKVAGLLDEIAIVDYTPLVDELYLRRVLGAWNLMKPVTVPVLVLKDSPRITDSIAIATWAAARSNGKLVVPSDSNLLSKIVDLAEQALSAGRYRATSRGAESGAFDLEVIPEFLRVLPNFAHRASTRLVNSYLKRKYSRQGLTFESALQDMRLSLKALDEIRLRNGGKFMFGTSFSLADIVAATSMAFVAHLPDGFSRVGPNMGEEWLEPELQVEFKDLLAWRDDIYRTYRGPFLAKEGRSKL